MPTTGSFRIDSRWALLLVLVAVLLMVAAYYVDGRLRTDITRQTEQARSIQERLRLASDLMSQLARAESSQRGYLITGQSRYLIEYQATSRAVTTLEAQLQMRYGDLPQRHAVLQGLLGLARARQQEMQATIALARTDGFDAARQAIAASSQPVSMQDLRAQVQVMESLEQAGLQQGADRWQRRYASSHYVMAAGTSIAVLLIVLAGSLVQRDLRRRRAETRQLDRLVSERTRELSSLSTHLQQVTEHERSTLARELHDELGSLLACLKVDLAQLAKHIDVTRADIAPRWRRIQTALGAGVELKSRIVEELRPALLDNLGLVAALKWQLEQRCAAAQLSWQGRFPDSPLQLSDDCAIALFRVAQEALTNVVKHARASRVQLSLTLREQWLELCIEDDGIGDDGIRGDSTGSAGEVGSGHGIRGMRHRIAALGGELKLTSAQPRGLRLQVWVPYGAASLRPQEVIRLPTSEAPLPEGAASGQFAAAMNRWR